MRALSDLEVEARRCLDELVGREMCTEYHMEKDHHMQTNNTASHSEGTDYCYDYFCVTIRTCKFYGNSHKIVVDGLCDQSSQVYHDAISAIDQG